MAQILVAYASDHGHTKRAAEAISEGALTIRGTTVRSRLVAEIDQDSILDADALVLGTPVHMGSMHWEMKRFIDERLSTLWTQDQMIGRVGGVFVTGGGLGGAGGGCELTMLAMLAVLAELGMVLVPLPKSTPGFQKAGLHWGPYARCGKLKQDAVGIPAHTIPTLQAHGANVASVAALVARSSERSVFAGAAIQNHTRRIS